MSASIKKGGKLSKEAKAAQNEIQKYARAERNTKTLFGNMKKYIDSEIQNESVSGENKFQEGLRNRRIVKLLYADWISKKTHAQYSLREDFCKK